MIHVNEPPAVPQAHECHRFLRLYGSLLLCCRLRRRHYVLISGIILNEHLLLFGGALLFHAPFSGDQGDLGGGEIVAHVI